MNYYVLYNPLGGTEGHSQQYTTQLCLALVDNGVGVHLVVSRDYDPVEVVAKGVAISFTQIIDSRKITLRFNSWLSKLRYGWFLVQNNFRSFSALNKVLDSHPRSTCLLMGGQTLTNVLYLLATSWRRRGTVFALTIHNADYDLALYLDDKVKLVYKAVLKLCLKWLLKTNAVIFVHGEAMQKALAMQMKVSPTRISIYKVPTPMGWQQAGGSPRLPSRPVRLLFCGVVRHDKGFDLLCEALAGCLPLADWQLRVAGSVRQVGEGYVSGLVAKHGITDNCSFKLHYLSSEDIDAEFQNCDIVVLPYRRGFIAQSVVMTDAMRWRRPVIASEHSQNGYDALKYGLGWVFTSEVTASLESALKSAIHAHLINRAFNFGFAAFMEDHSPRSVGRNIIAATAH